ncbi:MAG: hypothetical protein COC15_02735 [Legionellales bacterium]|nr:MAG: hypothetical protein COC15_02735 [Legionellales bacterium]
MGYLLWMVTGFIGGHRFYARKKTAGIAGLVLFVIVILLTKYNSHQVTSFVGQHGGDVSNAAAMGNAARQQNPGSFMLNAFLYVVMAVWWLVDFVLLAGWLEKCNDMDGIVQEEQELGNDEEPDEEIKPKKQKEAPSVGKGNKGMKILRKSRDI